MHRCHIHPRVSATRAGIFAVLLLSLALGPPVGSSVAASSVPVAPVLLAPDLSAPLASDTPTFQWASSASASVHLFELAVTPEQDATGQLAAPLLRKHLTTTSTPTDTPTNIHTNTPTPTLSPTVAATSPGHYVVSKQTNPSRSVVSDDTGHWVGTFTDGAVTVTLVGPARTFSEAGAAAPVTTNVWVRVLPVPFSGTVDEVWLNAVLTDQSSDVLQVAMQYITGALARFNDAGLQIASDAHYGPLLADGTRMEGSDFNDYLGMAWSYGATIDQPESDQSRSLDCSGFVRMVYGYRLGLPLVLDPDGVGLPRRAYQMLDSASGVVVLPNAGAQATDLGSLAPGDLVFFDAATNDGTQIDHVGIYLGRDTAGHARFISSWKMADGDTLGDNGGRSILDGTGLYAVTFRAARRL